MVRKFTEFLYVYITIFDTFNVMLYCYVYSLKLRFAWCTTAQRRSSKAAAAQRDTVPKWYYYVIQS